jgi:beta-glucosidase
VLFRAPDGSVRYDFRGRLPFSWPCSAHVPAVDHRPGEPPLFPYGYGLTYEDDGDLQPLP